MPFWNHCAICGKRIEVGEPCIGIEKKNTELVGDSICFDCVNIENIHGLDKTVAITALLARAEAAEKKATELDKALFDAAKVVRTMQERTIPYYRNRAEAAEKEVEWKNKVIEAAERRFVEAEARAEKAERERDEFKEKYIESVNRACELSKIVDEHGLEE